MSTEFTQANPPRHLRRYACPHCKCSLALVQAQGCRSIYPASREKCNRTGWGTLHRATQQYKETT